MQNEWVQYHERRRIATVGDSRCLNGFGGNVGYLYRVEAVELVLQPRGLYQPTDLYVQHRPLRPLSMDLCVPVVAEGRTTSKILQQQLISVLQWPLQQ